MDDSFVSERPNHEDAQGQEREEDVGSVSASVGHMSMSQSEDGIIYPPPFSVVPVQRIPSGNQTLVTIPSNNSNNNNDRMVESDTDLTNPSLTENHSINHNQDVQLRPTSGQSQVSKQSIHTDEGAYNQLLKDRESEYVLLLVEPLTYLQDQPKAELCEHLGIEYLFMYNYIIYLIYLTYLYLHRGCIT